MLQALIHKGSVKAEEIPAPVVGKGKILIRVINSCISAGTEMAGVSSSGKSPVRTMLEQPEKVRKILNMIRSEGLGRLLEQYRFLKESGQPTGYSVSGIVIGLGEDVSEFRVGDPVAAAGGGYAYHAEFVEVPKNLVVSIPSGVDFREASSVAIGAIALHGVRRTGLELGEYCVVMGNGILGLIAVQMLRISGIRVIAVDIDKNRLNTAATFGAEHVINPNEEDPVKAVENITGGRGTDAVLFAAATQDSTPLSQAFQMCRRKGSVILMGVSGMDLNRKDIYSGELDFRISTSYGPGRYDKIYEEEGYDYPYAYVRWTEGRNFTEYLRLLASKQVFIEPLIHQVYPIEEAGKAFDSLKETGNKPLIVILDYGTPVDISSIPVERKLLLSARPLVKGGRINVGILGIGNFAQSVHLPNLKKLGEKYAIYALASLSGVKAKNAGAFFNARYVTTQYDEIIADKSIQLVMICTRHGNHASLALKALEAGKHVFVEKPLATNPEDLRLLEDYFEKHAKDAPLLMVGFNRRFSPYLREIKKYTDNRIGPLFIHYRMNAGYQPSDHWTHQDGGRIIGEACHIIDLMGALTNCKILACHADSIETNKTKFLSSDNKSFTLKYEDGSLATVEYVSTGSRLMAKEYMEIHFDEKSIILDDYRQLRSFGFRIRPISSKVSNKGHLEELKVLFDHLSQKGQEWPIDWENLAETTRTSFTIA
jgi:predicted dehydrogenase/threonine dehydrogenase-like Zn-dependent dehydrogenase